MKSSEQVSNQPNPLENHPEQERLHVFHVYNTLSGQKERFKPLEPGKVRMYVCGPTVYDDAHLGHARCYITWDVLYRFLLFLGYDVRYARNITDVDDKILKRAAENNEPFGELAERYTQKFHEDMVALNTLSPTDEPKATEAIGEMIRGIEALLKKKMAYKTSNGSVYFRAAKKKDYGKLWKQPLEDLKSEARVEMEAGKESPLDFALWKATAPNDENSWDAPWGHGRPGWHLECSAMNHQLFGAQIDIHAGGADLIFPHHENEIAQSEAWTDHTPFSSYWMHNGFVNVSGEKMSKSLGNFSTIRTVLAHYDANTLRYFLLINHYRMPVDFNDEALQGAKNRMVKIHRAFKEACTVLGLHPDVLKEYPVLDVSQADENPYLKSFLEQMADDLKTPQALAVMDESIGALNKAIANTPDDLATIRRVFSQVYSIFTHLGFNSALCLASESSLSEEVMTSLNSAYTELVGVSSESSEPQVMLEKLIELRKEAKASKNWAQADSIRDRLGAIGIVLQDKKGGATVWEFSGN